jgi:hypothetical protein
MNDFDIEDEKINHIKSNFQKIIGFKSEINNIFENLELRINKLKEIYKVIKKETSKNTFLFGLDSLYFQSKLIDLELEHLKSFYSLINNKMYGSLYKLFHLIKYYINNNFGNNKKICDVVNIDTDYPIYKDLEPYKDYDFDVIVKLHEKIIEIIKVVDFYLNDKYIELENYNNKLKLGLNINNYVSTFVYENKIIKNEIELYINFLEFLGDNNYLYYKRFITKIKILLAQIDNDIKLDEKNSKKNMIDNLVSDGVNINLIEEIKNNLKCDSKDDLV